MLIENVAKIFYLVQTSNKKNAIIAKKVHVTLVIHLMFQKMNLTKNDFSREIKM